MELYSDIYLFSTMLAAMHYNENSMRQLATTQHGNLRFGIKYPKYKKRQYILKEIHVPATFSKYFNYTTCTKILPYQGELIKTILFCILLFTWPITNSCSSIFKITCCSVVHFRLCWPANEWHFYGRARNDCTTARNTSTSQLYLSTSRESHSHRSA